MDKKKLPTINLKGKEYVQVKDRLAYFNETFANGSIFTDLRIENNMVTFTATVTPDIKNEERVFTAHSFGAIEEVKALEKLETVAVGRALAFMGIGVLESVASADEMDRFHSRPEVTDPKSEKKLSTAVKLTDQEILDIGKTGRFEVKKGVAKTGRAYLKLDFDGQVSFLNESQYELLLSAVPKKSPENLPF